MTTVFRAVKFALQNFIRNLWLSLITVSMMMFTLLTINMVVMLNLVADNAISYVENKVEVSVYFKEGVSEERVATAASYLRSLAQVQDVRTVTPEQALERFKERHKRDEKILASLDEVGKNPFGPTLVVKAKDPSGFPFILESLDHPQFKNDIREKDFDNFEALIGQIRNTVSQVRLFGIGLSVIFLFLALLVVVNTVRMGIFIHREEIGVMRLVGASSTFIRAPFLIEAVLYTVLAVALTAAITLPIISVLDPKLAVLFEGTPGGLIGVFQKEGWKLLLGEAVILSLVSMAATAFAMRRYLKI